MVIDHKKYIPVNEFLDKYGVKPSSSETELADQAIILYSYWKGVPVPSFFLEPLMETDFAFWNTLTNTERLSYDEKRASRLEEMGFDYDSLETIVKGLLDLSSFYPIPSTYREMCSKIEDVPREEFLEEYPWLLIAMFEQSSLWAEKGYCPFGMTENLKQYLDSFDSVADLGYFEEGVNCFISAVFGGDKIDEQNAFALLMRDALPDRYIFHPSEDAWAERVLIEGRGAGWTVLRYPERYDIFSKVVYITPESDENNVDLVRTWMENGDLWGVLTTSYLLPDTGDFGRIIILNLEYNDSTVWFLHSKAEEIVVDDRIEGPVPYETIASFGYSLNPSSYTKPANPLNLPLVPLSEICEIDGEYKGCVRLGTNLPYYDFTTDFARLCSNASYPRVDKYNSEVFSRLYKGPHVHISKGMDAIVSHTSGVYHCQNKKSVVFRVKDNKVSEEYLAYVLTRDVPFMGALCDDPNIILNRKVAIHPDRSEQDRFIKNFLEKLGEQVLSSNYYNIIWIDPSFVEEKRLELTQELEDMQIGVRWAQSILESENGLEALLETGDGDVHAVVVDAQVDSVKGRFKGLRKAILLCHEAEIPLFVCSDADRNDLKDDLQEEDFQLLSDGHLSEKTPAGIWETMASIRKELDRQHDVSIGLRSQFRREFLAAEWLDDNLSRNGLHLVSDLTAVISAPNESMNIVRGILNSLYKVIVHEIGGGSGLEALDTGAIPTLLDDRVYRDKTSKLVFVIRGEVIPKTLARSLRFATDIANGASHKETEDETRGRMMVNEYFMSTGSENIAWAVIRIVMDFILYMKEAECRFNAGCEAFDPNNPEDVDWVGTVRKATKTEYCCITDTGVRVRLDYDPSTPPRVNSRIRISRLYREGRFVDLYQWYAKKNDWNYV